MIQTVPSSANPKIRLVAWIILSVTAWVSLSMSSPAAWAANPATVIRRISRIADDIPLRKADDLAQELGRSQAGRDLLRKAGAHVDDAASYRRALNRAVREVVDEAGDPTLLRHLDQLDDAAKEALLVMGRGSRTIREGIPDIATRGRFLADGGAETVVALGRYGDLMGDSVRFDAAVRAGRMTPPPGARQVTLEDFGHFFRTQRDRAHHFWTIYVRPHWGKWLGGTALAAVLLAPDEYLDQAGEFTQAGFRKVTKLGGDVLGAAIAGSVQGVGESTREATKQTLGTFARVFLSDLWGIAALVILLLAASVIAFCARFRIRTWLIRAGLINTSSPGTP